MKDCLHSGTVGGSVHAKALTGTCHSVPHSTAPLDQPAQQPGFGIRRPYTCLFDFKLCREVARGITYTSVRLAALLMPRSDRDMPKSEILRPPWTSRLSSRLSRRLWDPEARDQSV